MAITAKIEIEALTEADLLVALKEIETAIRQGFREKKARTFERKYEAELTGTPVEKFHLVPTWVSVEEGLYLEGDYPSGTRLEDALLLTTEDPRKVIGTDNESRVIYIH
jgi:hypothetical protein